MGQRTAGTILLLSSQKVLRKKEVLHGAVQQDLRLMQMQFAGALPVQRAFGGTRGGVDGRCLQSNLGICPNTVLVQLPLQVL